MRIEFYNVNDDNRVVSKNLGNIVHAIDNAQIYNATSIMSPDFLVDYAPYVVNSNYVYVPMWNRYYYVKDVTASPGGRAVMHCREDVLMSNADAIRALNAYVTRGQENHRDRNLIDSKKPVRVIRDCNTIKFPTSPFAEQGNFAFVLTVVGGKR